MPALSSKEAEIQDLRAHISELAKEIYGLKGSNELLRAELEAAIESTNHWYDKYCAFVRQAKAGRASFKSTIWRLVADRKWLRNRATKTAALIAFWDENVQYLDGYYLPAVRRDYKALKESIQK